MKKMKPQIVFIHGGMTFKNRAEYLNYLREQEPTLTKQRKWHREYLTEKLAGQYDIIRPSMPLAENARYEDWKIYFERYIPLLHNNVILTGNSLGGIFLAKYLSENKFPKKIAATFLICPPYDNSLPGEDLVGGFKLKSDLSLLEKQAGKLTLMFSQNDDVVPIKHAEKYQTKLPDANIIIYKNKNGHFQVASFPELIRKIKKLNLTKTT